MTECDVDISSSQEELLLHLPLLLNPLPPPPSTSTPSDALFAPSSNEPSASTSSSPNQQPPIRMVSLSDTPDDNGEDEFHSLLDHDTFDTPRIMDEDTVVPETEPPVEKENHPHRKSIAKRRRLPWRMNRWRVSFRKSPAGKKPLEEEDDRDRSADDDPFKEFGYVKPAEVKEAGVSGKLPASRVESPAKMPPEQEEGQDRRRGPTITMLSCLEEGWRRRRERGEDDPRFPTDIFDVLSLLVGQRERGPEDDVDILEVAREKGVRFSPPKWHRPGGYDADREAVELPGGRISIFHQKKL